MRYLEHVGVLGRRCGDRRRPGDGDRRRRGEVHGAGDLRRERGQMSYWGR